ncbi:MAG: TIGR04086 family membrane protein [Firmicutes bacterium]|nr:TIGR04086 family membrane protein [Bacillota bacterium]
MFGLTKRLPKVGSDSGKSGGFLLGVIKGSAYAVIVSLVCILLFAVIIKYTAIPEAWIQPVNQVIKGLSVLIGAWAAAKKIKSNGWLMGLLIGLVYTILAFLVFSILDGEFRFTLNILNDLLFGGIMGLIAGILMVNIIKR